MPRSKRLTVEVKGGELPEGHGYCRRCTKLLKHYDFYPAIDGDILDKSGYMSICKNCIGELYVSLLTRENGSVEKAMLYLCRLLNWRFSQEAIESAMKQTETTGADPLKLFGLYKAKLKVIHRTAPADNNVNLTYEYDTPITIQNPTTLENFDDNKIDSEVIEYWGEGYDMKDYRWLEKTLDEWKKTHKCDTKSEETLLREIVFKQFEIEKARKNQDPTANLIKELQDIMKTAAVDPAKASTANIGRSQETFSAFIKLIEENEPAEFYKDKELFKDYDNILWYFEKYVTRPLKNFITGSRDFNIEEGDEIDDDEVVDITPIGDSEETEE